MQHLTNEQLTAVTGGEDGGDGGGDFMGTSLSNALTASPSAGLNPIVGPPGTQYWENDHSGPTALERGNAAFDRSTRVMDTFNKTFGWTTRGPGFGR